MLHVVTKSTKATAGRIGFDGDVAMLRSEFVRVAFVIVSSVIVSGVVLFGCDYLELPSFWSAFCGWVAAFVYCMVTDVIFDA